MSREMSRKLSTHLLAWRHCALLMRTDLIQSLSERTFSLSSSQNTWILKRQYQLKLIDLEHRHPVRRQIQMSDQVYEVVECTHEKPTPPIQLLLLTDVPAYGKAGHLVTVPRNIARMFLLPEGKAEYVTPEGIAVFEAKKREEALHPELQSSSATSLSTVAHLSDILLLVPMNMHNPWKLERWHIRSALRLIGVWSPNDDVIELPQQEIRGPHLEMHGKSFSVFIRINGKERAHLLCQIDLRCKDPADALPVLDTFKPDQFEPLFPGAVSDENKPTTLKRRLPTDRPVVPRHQVVDF
ncbi:putative 39S ribosomal protein L9, mitochondrial [Hypsibius exemplaris]|uniref:Large ribosomal subunit protein bL9m n=1 Tax=Hypsibius exemplaris TaxID=2072580 RepID=A0A1W0XDW0_HYPEX|nr:putative 39S ribosomal protein L9, mitochondrial [Hypsibius exemplaris]